MQPVHIFQEEEDVWGGEGYEQVFEGREDVEVMEEEVVQEQGAEQGAPVEHAPNTRPQRQKRPPVRLGDYAVNCIREGKDGE